MFALLTILAAGAMAADIRPQLLEQGFSGPINGREEIAYVGQISQGPRDYQVYVFRGVFRAANVDHGVNRIIVMMNGTTFLGQYRIAMPTRCRISGQQVRCTTEAQGRIIQFTDRGPPAQIWFDGEILQFEPGSWAGHASSSPRT